MQSIEAEIGNHTLLQNKLILRILPFVVCTLASIFYVYEFTVRVMPSAMTQELMRAFVISAQGLGVLSSMFFVGYTSMQLPAGLLYDRLGTRKLLSISMFLCALTTLTFGLTDSITIAALSRLLTGLASAFAFCGAVILAARWFPSRYFAFIVGLIQLLGCIGAITGEGPIAIVVQHVGWRATMFWTAAFGIAIAILLWVIVRDNPQTQIQKSLDPAYGQLTELERLRRVLSKKQTWWLGLYSFTSWAPISVFGSMWCIPYLTTYYHTSNAIAASATSMIWIGIGIGSPLAGWLSNVINNRRIPLFICSFLGLVSSLSVLYIPHLSWLAMQACLFTFGLAASSQALSFGVVQDIHSPSVSGTAVGFNNMAVVSGGFTLLPLVGVVLKHLSDGTMQNGVPVYSPDHYQIALVVLPLCSLLGLIICKFFLKETYCLPQYTEEKISISSESSDNAAQFVPSTSK